MIQTNITSAPKSRDVRHLTHPLSDKVREAALFRLKGRKPKPRFGDARDAYLANKGTVHGPTWPCTSALSLSTMPRRQR